MEVHIAA